MITELSAVDREILEAVRREQTQGGGRIQKERNGNAPGHAHSRPGIWDEDNGAVAGQPCAWCLTWKKFTTLIAEGA